jgi:hypothetical protein
MAENEKETCPKCGDGKGLLWMSLAAKDQEIARLRQLVSDHEDSAASKRALVRQLDVVWNGDGAAEQASLCDMVAQISSELPKLFARLSAAERENERLTVETKRAVRACKSEVIVCAAALVRMSPCPSDPPIPNDQLHSKLAPLARRLRDAVDVLSKSVAALTPPTEGGGV